MLRESERMATKLLGEELFAPGHRACQGCGEAIAARLILRATGKNVIVVTPTGCLETFTSKYLYSPWEVPWIHPLFENAAAVASGIEAALKAKGRKDVKVVVLAGDGATVDIGFGMLSGMVERRHKVLYVCFDNGAYMNTGVQGSGATLLGASTTTTPAGKVSIGKSVPKKDVPAIMIAHGVDYVATATIAYPWDLIKKVKKALSIEGPSYIHVYTPCPTGEEFSNSKTVKISRLAVETYLFPLYEVENGNVTSTVKIKIKKPVGEYLKSVGWFKHLFSSEKGFDVIKKLQKYADANFHKYK